MSKWLSKLKKDADKINSGYKASWIADTASPGLNYLFGKNSGMKSGYCTLLYGASKSGKSLLSLAFAGQLHKVDPEAVVLHFDTEFRDNADTWFTSFGIDPERFISRRTNNPVEIFDYIATDVLAMLQEGCPIKLIIIDSLAMILYPKESNLQETTDFAIGDASSYLPKAMKKIIPIIRKYQIPTILCQHVRDQMDPMMQRVSKYQIPGGRGLKHSVEYWMLCEKVNAKDSKIFDSDRKDGSGNPIQKGHSIRVKMEESSLGPQNRSVIVNLDYQKGLVRPEYEVAEIAINMGVVERPNNVNYIVGDKKFHGYDNFVKAIADDNDLFNHLVEKIKQNDLT